MRVIRSQWKQFAGQFEKERGRPQAEGGSEYLACRLQEHYGIARDEARKQIREFEKRI